MHETTPPFPRPPRVNPELPFPGDNEKTWQGASELNQVISRTSAFRYNPTMNDVGRVVGDLLDLVCMAFSAAIGDANARAIATHASVEKAFHPNGQLILASIVNDPALPLEYRTAMRARLGRGPGVVVTGGPRPAGADGPYRLECSRGCGCAAEASDKLALACLVQTWEYRPHGDYTCPACSAAEAHAHALQEQGAAALHVRQPPGAGEGVRVQDGLPEAPGAGEVERPAQVP